MKQKIWLGCTAALCAAGILWGVWALAAPLFPAPEAASPAASEAPGGYYLRDLGGRVAVYESADADEPLAVYDIYVNLLPQTDVLRLKNGFYVSDAAALQRLLEDLGA